MPMLIPLNPLGAFHSLAGVVPQLIAGETHVRFY